MIFAAEEHVSAPADRVWRYLSVPELMEQWMPGLSGLRTLDGGPLVAGSRLIFASRGADRTSDVVDFTERRLIVLRSTQGPVTATYRYGLKPHGGGSTVTLEADCVATGAARLFMPLLRPLIRRSDGGQLVSLKAVVEDAGDCDSAPRCP